MGEQKPVIQCQSLTKSFAGSDALQGIDLSVAKGEILSVVGASGCGKTTLLRVLAGFEVPSSGMVMLHGECVASSDLWVPPRNRNLGMVFQDYALFPHLTVSENVKFGLSHLQEFEKRERIDQMLTLLRIEQLSGRYPHQISGGEQQRVALARSLAPKPIALLMDEPLSNLDPELRVKVRTELKEVLRSTGVTSIFVTHDQFEAFYMGDSVAVMKNGKLVQIGSPESVFSDPNTSDLADVFEMSNFLQATVEKDGFVSEIGVFPKYAEIKEGVLVEIMLRPDCVELVPSNSGMGRIVSRVFRGMHYLYSVNLKSGKSIDVLMPHAAFFDWGTEVDIKILENHGFACYFEGKIFQRSGIGSR